MRRVSFFCFQLFLLFQLFDINEGKNLRHQIADDHKGVCMSLYLSFSLSNPLPIDILAAFVLMASFAFCMYIKSQLCPDDEGLSELQLTDIRLERVSDKEKTILGRIDRMKVRRILLTFINTECSKS